MAALACWGFAGIARLAPGLGSALTDWPWEAAAWTITPALALIWWFREELTVSPPRVARSLCFGSLILTTQSVPPSAVHDVYVGESVTAPNASCVCLETAIGDLTFGRTLSPAEQEWVRGCTLAVIAGPTAPPKARKAPPPRLPRGAPADHARAAGWAA
jgi:hypothetical protein